MQTVEKAKGCSVKIVKQYRKKIGADLFPRIFHIRFNLFVKLIKVEKNL